MQLKNNALQVLVAWNFTMDQKACPDFKQINRGEYLAFVSRIRKSSDRVRIEYLHTTHFKLHRKTFVKMQESDDFADYVDQLIHLSHGFIHISCLEWMYVSDKALFR